ncbi:MAG: flagellar basal body P-ring protein FlgI [Planctomycetota bacterium]|nr:flagellar basal body P-ring protein FlgI [Planctomycetota bacterium]
MRRVTRSSWAAFALALLASASPVAHAQLDRVENFVRVKGHGRSVLQGIGLVMGLNQTGDSGKELVMARPLATVLQNSGSAVGALRELEKSRAVAIVSVTCEIPESGGLTNDRFDVHVAVINSASSLKGGRLYLSPMRGPFKGGPIYAVAQGPIQLEDDTIPTVGVIRGGAQLVQDVSMPALGDEFQIVVEPHFQGWSATAEIASRINSEVNPFGAPIAKALDERTVSVRVPEPERGDRANFIASVFATPVNISAMNLPAQVICNRRTGVIIATGDVTIEPAAITHADLTITTTIPPPVPTPQDPLIRREKWIGVQSPPASATDATRLSDLLAAFKSLDVPVEKQIEILQTLHKTGRLRAKLIIE